MATAPAVGDDDGGPHRCPSGEQAERHASESDMTDAVAHQREPPLHEIRADSWCRKSGENSRRAWPVA